MSLAEDAFPRCQDVLNRPLKRLWSIKSARDVFGGGVNMDSYLGDREFIMCEARTILLAK